jgi:hypothetical protein
VWVYSLIIFGNFNEDHSKSRSLKNSYAHRRRKLKLQSHHKELDITKISIVQAFVYIHKAPLSGGSHDFERFTILAKGRCFFGPSVKGLRSCRSLNLLQRNKLIMRGATVGGLPLPKVLKT